MKSLRFGWVSCCFIFEHYINETEGNSAFFTPPVMIVSII